MRVCDGAQENIRRASVSLENLELIFKLTKKAACLRLDIMFRHKQTHSHTAWCCFLARLRDSKQPDGPVECISGSISVCYQLHCGSFCKILAFQDAAVAQSSLCYLASYLDIQLAS